MVLFALAACSTEAAVPERHSATDPVIGRASGTPAASAAEAQDPPAPPAPANDAGGSDAGPPDANAPGLRSHFECKALGGGTFRPYWLRVVDPGDGGSAYQDYGATAKGLLGQNAMTSLAECDKARAAANDAFGVICSRTGLDGYKPTLYTGTVPGRADFGYLGGSSIMNFDDCLKATKNSSASGVCFWGGSEWYVSPIDKEGVTKGPFATIDACVAQTSAP